jgi:hypothetical protein
MPLASWKRIASQVSAVLTRTEHPQDKNIARGVVSARIRLYAVKHAIPAAAAELTDASVPAERVAAGV